MAGQSNRKVVAGGMIALGCLLVGLIVGLVSAGAADGLSQTFYLPAVSYEFTDLQWTEVGVPDVDEYTFEIDPNDPQTLYVGAYGPQAWRSQDSGQSWEIIGNGLPVTSAVRHIAAAPLSPTLIYAEALGWPHQIYRSMDGGDNWQGLSRVHGYRLLSLAVNPITSTILYAGASIFDSTTYGGEVYRSLDGGNNWERVLPSFTMADVIVVDPQHPNVVYLGTYYHGLLKSVDSGASWQVVNNGLPSNDVFVRNIVIHPDDSQIVYITADGQLYRSSEGGNNWVSIGSGLPVPWLSTVVMNPDNPDEMFATPAQGNTGYGVYRSLDGGFSWHRLAPSPVNLRAKQAAIQIGDSTNLFVLFDSNGGGNGRLWKLGPISP